MKNSSPQSLSTNSEVAFLFERVAGILESGRGRALRTINHETVLTYWLIGREIVQALQGGRSAGAIWKCLDRRSIEAPHRMLRRRILCRQSEELPAVLSDLL